jgi:hypothetical protein
MLSLQRSLRATGATVSDVQEAMEAMRRWASIDFARFMDFANARTTEITLQKYYIPDVI